MFSKIFKNLISTPRIFKNNSRNFSRLIFTRLHPYVNVAHVSTNTMEVKLQLKKYSRIIDIIMISHSLFFAQLFLQFYKSVIALKLFSHFYVSIRVVFLFFAQYLYAIPSALYRRDSLMDFLILQFLCNFCFRRLN
jgi:hypothetical protein